MNLFKYVLCVSFFLFFIACDSSFGKDESVVVSVGNSKLCKSDIKKMIPDWDSKSNQDRLKFLELWINEETIYQEAILNGVDKDSVLNVQIEQTIRKMIVDRFLQSFEDTMMVSDAEKIDFYHAHHDLFLRGETLISGAMLFFKNWQDANTYYKKYKDQIFDSIPSAHYTVKKIELFDSLKVNPDTCMIANRDSVIVGKLSPMKLCNGALKMVVVTQKLDSTDILPYEEVASNVETLAWVEHRKVMMDSLKKEWKKSRPIFSKTDVFLDKDK